MIRPQISLEEGEMEVAHATAESYGTSLAEQMRRALRKEFPPAGGKPWMKYCGSITSGKSATAEEIDELVYGRKD
jgi:hypothetical protein